MLGRLDKTSVRKAESLENDNGGKMIVEIIEIKNGSTVKRAKRDVSFVEYDDNAITLDDTRFSFSSLSCDKIKLIVDDNLWLNKLFLKFDFSCYEIGKTYEVSDDQKCWKKMELVRINEDEEHPFTCKNSQDFLFSWAFAREVINV